MYKIIGADGREYGPVSLAQLRQWLAEGRLNAQTRVLADGASDWKTLAALPEFALAGSRPGMAQPIRPLTGLTSHRVPQTNAFAVAGLSLAIFSFVLSFCCCGGLPLNLLGLLFSAIGLAQINRQPEVYTGKGAAVAGLIISGLSLVLGLGILAVSVVLNWADIVNEVSKC